MPYICEETRDAICNGEAPHTPGELNYYLTIVLLEYLEREYNTVGYVEFNEVIGVLGCVTQEFYRRMLVPYEERKKLENGDIFVETKKGRI